MWRGEPPSETKTIPIVIATMADPVGGGFVASLARPGGNVTGLTVLPSDVVAKRLQIFKEAFPGVSRIALLVDIADLRPRFLATGDRGCRIGARGTDSTSGERQYP